MTATMSCLLPRVGAGWNVNYSSPPQTRVHSSGHRSKHRPPSIRGFVQEATSGLRPCAPPTRAPHRCTPGSQCPPRPGPQPDTSALPPGHTPEHDFGLLAGGWHSHFDRALPRWHRAWGQEGTAKGQPTTRTPTHGVGQPGKACPARADSQGSRAELWGWSPQNGQGEARCPPRNTFLMAEDRKESYPHGPFQSFQLKHLLTHLQDSL